MGYTVRTIEEMQARHGIVRLAAAELGVESFGMQLLDLPAHFAEYPAHDHAGDGQEEVYVVLTGSAELEVDGDRVPLGPATMARVEAASRRKLWPGADGARVLAVGCTPGGAYRRPDDFRLAVRT